MGGMGEMGGMGVWAIARKWPPQNRIGQSGCATFNHCFMR